MLTFNIQELLSIHKSGSKGLEKLNKINNQEHSQNSIVLFVYYLAISLKWSNQQWNHIMQSHADLTLLPQSQHLQSYFHKSSQTNAFVTRIHLTEWRFKTITGIFWSLRAISIELLWWKQLCKTFCRFTTWRWFIGGVDLVLRLSYRK